MNYKNIAIGLFIGALAFFIIYLISIIYFKSLTLKGKDVNFRNTYPYEIYSKLSILNRVLLYGSLFANVALGAIGFFFAFQWLGSNYAIIIGSVYAVSFLALVISNVIPLSLPRLHLLSALFGILGFAFASILTCFMTIIPNVLLVSNSFILPMTIIIGILGFLVLLSSFNPKLLSWTKLDKAEIDGKTIYVKPKINFLASYEWLVYLFYNATILLIFISLFF